MAEADAPITPAPITAELGAWVAGLRFAALPARAIDTARRSFIDTVGVSIAGRNEPPVQILTQVLAPQDGPSSLLFGPRRGSAPDAALINGTAAHALELDDVALRGHPGCVLVPAILAEAEALGASGERMITAFVAAFEIWAELVLREPDFHHRRGWHTTGWFGAVAAAGAIASLRGLDARQVQVALGIAASQAAGLMANTGTMTKPYHAGHAARAGLLAARLTEAGFSGEPDALEHGQGLLRAMSPHGRVDLTRPVAAGRDWWIERQGVAIRRFPVCYLSHRLIDGMLDLAAAHQLRADGIERITVTVSASNAGVLRNHRPQTGFEAKISAEFAMAAAVIAGDVGLAEIGDDFVARADVQALIGRTRMEIAAEENPVTGYAPFDSIVVETRDGGRIESPPLTTIVGSPARPLTSEKLEAKFRRCVAYATGTDEGERRFAGLYERLSTLETVTDIRALAA